MRMCKAKEYHLVKHTSPRTGRQEYQVRLAQIDEIIQAERARLQQAQADRNRPIAAVRPTPRDNTTTL